MNYAETPPISFIYASVNKWDSGFSPFINIKTDNACQTLDLLCALYCEAIKSCSEGDKDKALMMIEDINCAVKDITFGTME